MKISNPFKRLTKYELMLWITSMVVIFVSAVVAGGDGILSSSASIIGVTALIFVAKGDAFGQLLTIIFSIVYGIISYKFKYYGELITYVCMSAPAALVTMITWLKHPYTEHEVKIDKLSKNKWLFTAIISTAITIVFYFILKALGTTNLIVSTISILTSSFACILLIFRSPYYAIAYSTNDIVLIILWALATIDSIEYLPMILCFVVFLANDLYGFYNWRKIRKRQV